MTYKTFPLNACFSRAWLYKSPRQILRGTHHKHEVDVIPNKFIFVISSTVQSKNGIFRTRRRVSRKNRPLDFHKRNTRGTCGGNHTGRFRLRNTGNQKNANPASTAMCCGSREPRRTRPHTVTVVQQLSPRTARLLQSLDNGLVGLYADLSLSPRRLIRRAGQIRLGLLQVGLGSLKIETNKKTNKRRKKKITKNVTQWEAKRRESKCQRPGWWCFPLEKKKKANRQSQACKAALSSS